MTYPPVPSGRPGPQGHNYPPPPPQPYSSGPDQFSVTPRKSPALKWVLLGVVVLVALVVAAGAVFYLARDRGATEASQVRSGDCLADIPDSSRVLYVKSVSCDQPHKGEVFAVLPLPDGGFPGRRGSREVCRQVRSGTGRIRPRRQLGIRGPAVCPVPDGGLLATRRS